MVIRDIIDKEHQLQIEDVMTSLSFPWFFNKWVDQYPTRYHSVNILDSNIFNSFQFSHVFYDNGAAMPTYNMVEPLLSAIISKHNIRHHNVLRVKANLTTAHEVSPEKYQIPHVDTSPPCRTFIYYVNDSDGETVLFNETVNDNFDKFTIKELSEPIRGSVLSFDGSHYHAGRYPRNTSKRIVINFVIR